METVTTWINKYKPQSIKDIINRDFETKKIKQWLLNYESEKQKFFAEKKTKKEKRIKKKKKVELKEDETEEQNDNNMDENIDNQYEEPISKKNSKRYSCMVVYGNHGSGKSCVMDAILSELNFTVDKVDMCSLSANKNTMENINKMVKGTNIFDKFHVDREEKRRVIVVDELESCSTQTEKRFVENLFKENEDKWYLPIIFISSLKHSKLINSLKANSLTVEFKQPTNNELSIFGKNIVMGEKIRFVTKGNIKDMVTRVVDYAQMDYRRLLYILYDLKKTYKSGITNDNITEYMQCTKKKETDVEIKKCTADLVTNYTDMNECERIYNGEKVLIPLMMHQNFPMYINKQSKNKSHKKGNKKENLDVAAEISESLSKGDIIENFIYSEQNWDMHNVHCYYSCINPSYKLSSLDKNIDGDLLKHELQFPDDLNRTSIKNINKRNVVNANAYLRNMDINDFMCANTLTSNLIEDKRIKECGDIYKEYGAKAETIASVLKINKITYKSVDKLSDKGVGQINTKKLFNKIL